jgi:hypothetical protein
MEIIDLLGYSAISLLFARYFTPIQGIKEYFIDKGIRWMIRKRLYWLDNFFILWSCPVCLSFWFTLFMTYSLPLAAITSIFTKIVYLIIERYSNDD